MNSLRQILLMLVLGIALLLDSPPLQAQPQYGPTVPVQGQLISRAQGAIPGVTVFLVHPVLGRSAPSYTDVYGRFGWVAIPVRMEWYYLEVYWGQNLIYRQPVQVIQPMVLPPIYM